MKVVDAFIFYNELEILEARFTELYDVVDFFILVEGNKTFTGMTKPLLYNENKEKFKKYNDKVVHVIVDDYPETDNPWIREAHQRNCISRGVLDLKLNRDDLIIISDVDEIVSNETIYNFKHSTSVIANAIYRLEMQLYYYTVEWTVSRKWYSAKILTMDVFNTLLYPEIIRHYECNNTIKNAGWHISYLGGTDFITNKLRSFSETQDCNSKNLNKSYLNSCISGGVLFFNNEKLTYVPFETNTSLPRYFLKK